MRTLLETVEQLLETVDDLKAEVSDLRAEVDAPKARAHRMTTRSTVKRNIGSGIVKRLRKRRK